jgi:hypothetical protein
LGCGLKKLCLLPGQATIGVFAAASCLESSLALIAGNLFGWPVCGLFDQSTAETVVHVAKEGGIAVMLVSAIYSTFVIDTCKKIPQLKYVIQIEDLR